MQTKHHVAAPRNDGHLVHGADNHSLVGRLRQGIAEAGLDRCCQGAANEMLDRIDAEENLARTAASLADARRMRDAIVLVLGLLGELDELMPDEPDRSAFAEIAGLFQDVADFALLGAAAARQAAGEEGG